MLTSMLADLAFLLLLVSSLHAASSFLVSCNLLGGLLFVTTRRGRGPEVPVPLLMLLSLLVAWPCLGPGPKDAAGGGSRPVRGHGPRGLWRGGEWGGACGGVR